ncbi:N-acetylmuramoyl-L-alanine amidase [Bacillus solimangrovi]|uniref:SLH domain-containing protein n=1 Tax=Bacillus solimangrovi TaxID=1305675 RepID=A0A1E5LFG8_9BACI|nr:N-acetylmuramoyl-L-alanine amidase [Bacillus solimangrovi]OEH92827.1 hypothetical protein BFG57_02195 [Bacillus solimangrovi]
MKKIAIDIGHGEDTYNRTGSKGVPGLEEHHFNAAVGIELKKQLEFNGFEVFYTQPPYQKDVGLQFRTELANKKNADLFFSIHADANSDKNVEGHWAFYWHTSAEGKHLAQFLNEEMNRLIGTPPIGSGIKACLPNVSWPNFHVIRETNMVAVLHEHDFMTSRNGLKRLQSNSFRLQSAKANARAICRYFNVTYKEPTQSDYENHWAKQSIEKAINKGVMKGYGDGLFKPDQLLTRAELATVLDNLQLLD